MHLHIPLGQGPEFDLIRRFLRPAEDGSEPGGLPEHVRIGAGERVVHAGEVSVRPV